MLQAKSARLSLLQKNINKLGQITGADISLMAIGPEDGASLKPGVTAAIKESVKQLDGAESILKQTHGAVGVQRRFVATPNGLKLRDDLTGQMAVPRAPVKKSAVK